VLGHEGSVLRQKRILPLRELARRRAVACDGGEQDSPPEQERREVRRALAQCVENRARLVGPPELDERERALTTPMREGLRVGRNRAFVE
jgi:hypothetical protein